MATQPTIDINRDNWTAVLTVEGFAVADDTTLVALDVNTPAAGVRGMRIPQGMPVHCVNENLYMKSVANATKVTATIKV